MPPFLFCLVRHEEAEPDHPEGDELRALTPRGRKRMRQTAQLVAEHLQIDHVLTSPLVRAVQTSEILIDALALETATQARSIIAHPHGYDGLTALALEFPAATRGIAMVGHEPTLSGYAAHLLGIPRFPLDVRTGTVIALRLDRRTRRAAFEMLIYSDGPKILKNLGS